LRGSGLTVVAHCGDRFHPLRRKLARRIRLQNDAELLPRTERNDDPIADLRREGIGQRVIEQLRQRHGKADPCAGIPAMR